MGMQDPPCKTTRAPYILCRCALQTQGTPRGNHGPADQACARWRVPRTLQAAQWGNLATVTANSVWFHAQILILPYGAFSGTSSIPASLITAPISNPREKIEIPPVPAEHMGHPLQLLPCQDITAQLCFSSTSWGDGSRDSAAQPQHPAPCTAQSACATRRRHLSQHLFPSWGQAFSGNLFFSSILLHIPFAYKVRLGLVPSSHRMLRTSKKNHQTCRR